MTTHSESNQQNETAGSQSKPNQQTPRSVVCTCYVCEPKSWARLSKHLDVEISRRQIARLYGSPMPGGFCPPHVLKKRYEEVREMHKRGIFEGF